MAVGDRTVLLLTDARMAAHAWPGHPERPERLEAAVEGVVAGAAAVGADLVRRSAPPATEEDVSAVHDRRYLAWLARSSADGGAWLDSDTFVVEGSVDAAFLAAGQAVAGSLSVAAGESAVAFAAVRPPGHHAHREGGRGFCLLNNVVIAAAALRSRGLARRIAILDWDVHHGDGTQALVADDPDVFYASTHQFPWYPGTGAAAERTVTTVNVPLPAGSDDVTFAAAWRDEVLPLVAAFRPEAVVLSAGFDAHFDDPLAGLLVTEDGFGEVATMIGAAVRRAGLAGLTVVLEGGYDADAIRVSAAATVRGLMTGMGSPAGEMAPG